MTEQQILELITQEGFHRAEVTQMDLVHAYAKQLARIADQLHCQDFVALITITALLYKMNQGRRAADRAKSIDVGSKHR